MREIRDIGKLLLGFLPWLLFLFFSGNSLTSLEHIIWICLAAAVLFGFSELRDGFLLQWGSLVFFAACAVFVNGFQNIWVATHMDLLANISLAAIVWMTILGGKPFALQYARRELPIERWNDPEVVAGARFITLFWALLMSLSAGISLYRRCPGPQASQSVYFGMSLAILLGGMIFTTLFKRKKRLERDRRARQGAADAD